MFTRKKTADSDAGAFMNAPAETAVIETSIQRGRTYTIDAILVPRAVWPPATAWKLRVRFPVVAFLLA